MKRFLAFCVAVALIPVMMTTPASAGGDTFCGDFPQEAGPGFPPVVWVIDGETINGNLIVEQGIACELRSSTVNGNVTVEEGTGDDDTGIGVVDGSTVNGDIEVDSGSLAFLDTGSKLDGNLIASDGANFVGVFEDSRVTGDVKVGVDAVGILEGGTVDGNYECVHCVFEDAVFSTIGGNLSIHGEQDGSFIIASTIKGNLEVTNSTSVEFPVVVTSAGAFQPPGEPVEDPTFAPTVIHGDLVYKGNKGPLVLQYSEVRGNVEVAENNFRTQIPDPEGPGTLPAVIRNNEIGGDVKFEKNRRGSSVIADNSIGGKLECKSNRPRPGGSGNVADEKVGQCRAL